MDDAALAKLEKLADMKSKGILTEEEFAQQKAAVLSGEIVSPKQVAPVMMQPGMMGNQRPPPPGCPPGGQFLMVKYNTGKNCCGCPDRRLTSEFHGKCAADGTSFTMQGIFGLIHGALTSYDTDSNVATYSFNGPGVSGTWVIDGNEERITSHSKTVAGGRCYEFKFELRR